MTGTANTDRQEPALALAIRFHETYERLAPSFGYETRTETRAFDPTTPNGRLMVAVCGELMPALSSPVADGGDWVLVPREPTEAMIDAWFNSPREGSPRNDEHFTPPYQAMLAAAPTATPGGKHRYYYAGEPDCPREIKAGNGELHTLRCRVCGQDNPRGACAAPTAPAGEDAAAIGWKACRRQVFALCEHTQDTVGDTPFENGRRHEAKGIARAMNAFGPEDCSVLRAALASTPAQAEPVAYRYRGKGRFADAEWTYIDDVNLNPDYSREHTEVEPLYAAPAGQAVTDAARLDYIERTFSGMTNRERYLPVQMIWGVGANGRTLREACDKYMAREAQQGQGHTEGGDHG